MILGCIQRYNRFFCYRVLEGEDGFQQEQWGYAGLFLVQETNVKEDRQSQWKMFDECLWAEEKNRSRNDTRRDICLWLSDGWHCCTALPAEMPDTLQPELTVQMLSLKVLWKKAELFRPWKAIRTSEMIFILTDWRKGAKSMAKAYRYFFNLAMIYNGFLPMAIWRQNYAWFCSLTIWKVGVAFWQFLRSKSFF